MSHHRVSDAVSAINGVLDVIAERTLYDATYPEVAAELRNLWATKDKVEWILFRIRNKNMKDCYDSHNEPPSAA